MNLQKEIAMRTLAAEGTSEGAKKGWDKRGRSQTPPGPSASLRGLQSTLEQLQWKHAGTRTSGAGSTQKISHRFDHPAYGMLQVDTTRGGNMLAWRHADGENDVTDGYDMGSIVRHVQGLDRKRDEGK